MDTEKIDTHKMCYSMIGTRYADFELTIVSGVAELMGRDAERSTNGRLVTSGRRSSGDHRGPLVHRGGKGRQDRHLKQPAPRGFLTARTWEPGDSHYENFGTHV